MIPINLPVIFQSPYQSTMAPTNCCCGGGKGDVNIQINPDSGFMPSTAMDRQEQASALLEYARKNGFVVFQGA